MTSEVRIGVVVVHYGTDELTLRCLRALVDDRGSPPTRIVLVDNGPGEGVAARVRAELPEVRVVVPGRNTGFAGGCNRGIAALGPVELVALVNSDVVVTPGWLTPLVAALDADPQVGAAVPKTLLEPAEGPEAVIGNVGNVRDVHGYVADRGWREVDRGQYDEPSDVVAWCGGAALLRSAYLEDVGRFDERLFLYYEDVDLSLRGTEAGWRYRYEPASVVEHRQGSSASADADRSERLKERNRLLVVARHDGIGRLLVELARFVGITVSYARRDLLARPRSGRMVALRSRALAEAVVRIPGALRSRAADAGRRRRRRRGMRPLA